MSNEPNGTAIERMQAEATAQFYQHIATNKPFAASIKKSTGIDAALEYDNGDPVVKVIHAKSFRGQRPPQFNFDQWLTVPPDLNGKFVLVNFFRTVDCDPCMGNIPHLNDLQQEFKDRLVVIGLSDESIDGMRQMQATQVNHSVATDVEARTRSAVELTGIPHAMLMDPKGIVRFEGQPVYLQADDLENLILKYSN